LRKNGATFPVISSLSPILNGKREIVGMSEIVHDITVRKDMEAALLRNEAKYRSIFENAVEGIFQTTEQGRHLRANPAYVRMFGYSSEEELIAEISDVGRQMYANPDDRARFLKLMEQNGEVRNFEVEAIRKDGASIWLSVNARAVKDMGGHAVFFEGMAEDRTKRKRAENCLILEKKISDSIIDSLPGIFYLFDDQLNYIRWNSNLEKISGYSGEELSRLKPIDFFTSEDRIRIGDRIRECFEKGETTTEAELLIKDGSTIPYFFTGKRVVLDNKVHLLGVGIDISERKKAEQTISEREEKYRQLFELESDAIFLIDNETGQILEANKSASSLYGYSKKEFLQRTNADLSAEPARTSEATRIELRVVPLRYHKKKDGTVFPVEITATHMTWNGRKSHLAAIRDISDRQKIEEALLKREEDYRNIYDNAMVGIFQSLPEGKYFRVNSALARIHGFDSPDEMISTVTNIGEHLYVNPEDRKRYMKLLDKTSKITGFEAQLYRKDRVKIWISMNVQVIRGEDGAVAYYEGIVEDITERKKAEEDLKASAEKLRKNLAGTIEVISMMLQTRDPYTGEHQKRVSGLAWAIAQEMKLPADTIDSIRIAGSIHDIGKMSVPAEILAKPTRLSDVEMDLLKVHPQTGYDILKVVELPPPIAQIVLQHHERLDGSGYPQGLKEAGVLLEAQIIAVADVVEAMSSHRPYRPALGIDAALREIEGGKGALYHPEVVDTCLRLFRGKTFSFG
ncbi:MAG: PAS domain S-box protein, partial [Syntrophorhabdaceae bacterium]|nr:PAS domain S-box protein [Syntrophorhabdaceae bacterium]